MKFDFSANRQQAEKQFNLGKGEYFKVKDGANKVRLVSACLPHPGSFNGKPTFKWLCQVLDLSDNKVKPYFMPDTVYQQILSLQTDEDYSFDEVPMPYSINIQTENAGDITVKYSVIPSPKRVPLTLEQEQALQNAPSVQELQAKIKEAEKPESPAQAVQSKPTTPADIVSQASAGKFVPHISVTPIRDEINVEGIPF